MEFKYEVFLSFRGVDTRNNFTSHLYRALRDRKVETFMDDRDLKRGYEISPSLLKAIEESHISLVVFSKSYASSSWCLEELVKILQCKQLHGQIVMPVFCEVDPSDVRNQTGSYSEAFVQHEQRFQDRVQTWKDALKEASNLSGFDSLVTKPESVLIENIVQDVMEKLSRVYSNDNNGLVGIDSRINEIEALLQLGLKGISSVGIWGVGGIGKTTLAGALFDKIIHHFEGSCFLHNVREELEQNGGLNRLRKEFYQAVLGDGNSNTNIYTGSCTFAKKILGRKKLLIVFDDVTNFRQIEGLIVSFDCLGSGSRVIMTSRDKQVLNNCRVDQIYEVKDLPQNDAFKLFCQCAFRKNQPMWAYEELSWKVVNYLGGIPLALKVLGSSLLDKGKEVWESSIGKLEKVLERDIYEVLKISYDGLNDSQQKIFLDIACFLNGKDIVIIKRYLDACDYFSDVEISILVDKSLIVVSDYNTVTMHDLLQAMGREIVRRQSIEDPGQRTHLWHHEDIYHVLTNNLGSNAIQGLSFDMSKTTDIYLNPCVFVNMQNLRYLEFYSTEGPGKNKVHISEELHFVFNKLRYLHWYACPFKSLPSKFHSEHLVELSMRNSNMKQLSNGFLKLVNLKKIDLSESENLISCPDLSACRNVEFINLGHCTSLLEISSSLQFLTKLTCLYLHECESLKSLPDCLSGLKALESLFMFGSLQFKMLPELPDNIKILDLGYTAVEVLSPAIDNLNKLVELRLRECYRLKSLPNSLCKLKSLEYLYLSHCSQINKLPHDIGHLKSLKVLDVVGTAIREVPSTTVCWSNVETLSFRSCKLQDFMSSFMLGLCSLKSLDLTNCGISLIPYTLGHLSQLRRLYLGRNCFESIPASIVNLPFLEYLDVSFCHRLLVLPELPSTSINAINCFFLAAIPLLSVPSTVTLGTRFFVSFANCFNLYQNGLEIIIDDVLPKLPLLASLWTKQPYLPHVKCLPGASLCFPGSEVPEWFSFRCTGSSITGELPTGWNNSSFVGFGLCAVTEIEHHGLRYAYDLYIECECNLKSRDGEWHSFHGMLTYQPFHKTKLYHIESDHLCIGCDHLMYPRNIGDFCHDTEVTFKFCIMSAQRRLDCCRVKSCGVRLMYAEDHGQSSGSFDLLERGDEPLLKRFKVSSSATVST